MYSTRRERAVSAAASAAIVSLLAGALVYGLRPDVVRVASGALVAVVFPTPTPSPSRTPPPPPQSRSRQSAAASAAPAGPRAHAAPIVAPPVPVVIVPPPMPVATVAGSGAAMGNGASTGSGQGAGGAGNGSGGGGSGDGNGYGPGVETPPEQIRGHMSPSDLHSGVLAPGTEGSVGVAYVVTAEGRVTGCHVTRSSGIPELDALPCPLIEKRFVFRPALDRFRRPVPSTIVENHTWIEQPTREQRRGF